MINFREVLRRFLKYLILALVSLVSIYSIPEKKPNMIELIKISVIIGITYCVIDIVTPSIQIIVNKDNSNKDVDIDVIENENENEN